MTKKDFELIARALTDARHYIPGREPKEHVRELLAGIDYSAEFLADALATTNPKFDRAKFLSACGVSNGC